MTGRGEKRDMKKCTGILLVFVSTVLTLLQATAVASIDEKQVNVTHELSNVPSENGTNLLKIDEEVSVDPLKALNINKNSNSNDYIEGKTPFQYATVPLPVIEHDSITTTDSISNVMIEKSLLTSQDTIAIPSKSYKNNSTTNRKLLLQDKKIDDTPKKNLIEQLIIGVSHPIVYNEKHHDILTSEFDDEENDDDKLLLADDKKIFNHTESKTVITKSTNNSGVISLINDTKVNYRGINIKQIDDVITMENVTVQTLDNVTTKYSNIVENSNNTKGQVKIQYLFNNNTELSDNSKRIMTDDDKELLKPIKIITTNNQNMNVTDNKYVMIKPTLKNITSSTERIDITHDKNNFTPKGRTIAFGNMNEFSNVNNEEIGIIKDIKPYPYVSNKNSNVKPKDNILPVDNTISKSNGDEKLIITESPAVINDNSIKQIKQSKYYKKFDNSSIINLEDTSKTSINFTNLKSQNIINSSSLTLGLTVEKNVNDISRNVGGSDVLIEKRSNLDLTDNGLHEAIDKNSSNSKLTAVTNIPLIKRNESLSEIHFDIQRDIQDSKFIISPINITENTTKLPELINTYSSLTSVFTSSSTHNPLSTSISPTLSPILSTFDVITSTSATTINIKSEVTSPLSTTTSLSISASPFPTLQTFNTDNSSGRANDLIPTTISNIEYEFIGLSGSTNWINKNETIDDEKININISTTSIPKFTVNSTISSSIEKSSMANDKNNLNNSITIIKPNISNSSMITDLSNIHETISTVDDKFLDTTTPSAITNFESHSDTAIVDETTTPLPHTVTFTFNPSSTSSLSIMPSTNEQSTVADLNNESATTDGAIETTTVTMSSSSVFQLNTDVDTSTALIDTTIVTNVEDTTTISTIQIVTDIPLLVPEDVTVLIRIVIETSWSDMCSQLSVVRQALADILSAGMDKVVFAHQVIIQKNPCIDGIEMNGGVTSIESTVSTTLLLYMVDQNGNFDATLTKALPNLYRQSPLKLKNVSIRSFQLVEDADSGNAIAVIVVSCVAFICLVLLATLLFVMRKRQTRFNYGERCRPVSLDAYSLDSVSAHNSVRRKGTTRTSKRSYGNPTFEDSSAIPSHPLNFAGLSAFCNEQNAIYEEFSNIPQVTARIDELPNGAEIKNRYANVIPLPETRVPLMKINNDPLTEYINASYIRGPKNAIKYYIGCQAPMDNTVVDFWRMIWEQQTKVIIMLTDFIENGVEKCSEYIPPSEVTDCHRIYGDYQVTLKKRETKEKYAISTLHLKNLENNTYREVSHIWYLWPINGAETDAAGLIAILLEARAAQRGGAGPIVVHCSPGTGRTGTIIALDLGIRQYEITRTIDVPRVVYTIRRDRAGSVQTKEQYSFIYKALNLYATKLAGGGLEST